jgi:hypothetical protein
VYIYPRVSVIHSGFGYPFGFRVSAGLVLVMDFHPNRFSVRVRVSFWVHEDSTRSEPDPLPSLPVGVGRTQNTEDSACLVPLPLLVSPSLLAKLCYKAFLCLLSLPPLTSLAL